MEPAIFVGTSFMLIMGLFVLAVLLSMVFWVWMLIDCVQRDFKKDSDKIVWVLLMLFLGVIPSIIYYFVVKRK